VYCSQCTPVAANTFHEDFEADDTMEHWHVQRNVNFVFAGMPCHYGGQPASWQHGGGQLSIQIGSYACSTEITPTHFLMRAEDTFSFWVDVQFPWGVVQDSHVLFLWKNADEWYAVRLFDQSGYIEKTIGGSSTRVDGSSFSYPFVYGANYRFHVQYNTATRVVTVKVNDTTAVQAVDTPPYITGDATVGAQAGVGWGVPRAATVFDNMVVESETPSTPAPSAPPLPSSSPSPPTPPLNTTYFLQTDPRWGGLEYDTALRWSPKTPSIARWGCAMVSAANILRWHGITRLPSGTPLTPETLNTWLKQQSDGYIGDGLLNWLAITRLTALMAASLQTPKLEYKKEAGSLAVAQARIRANQPVILQMAGHFLMGYALIQNTEIVIHDPYYAFTLWKQHHTALLSVRTFTPSQTDLSYIQVVTQPAVHVSLQKESGALLSLDTSLEYVNDPESSTTTTQYAVHALPKPDEGPYVLRISRDTPGWFESVVQLYRVDGTVTQQTLNGFISATPLSVQLQTAKSGLQRITPLITFAQLQADVDTLAALKLIRRYSSFLALQRTTQLARQTKDPVTLRRYHVLFSQQLRQFALDMTPDGYAFLQRELAAITPGSP
jgi:hypothetical protein